MSAAAKQTLKELKTKLPIDSRRSTVSQLTSDHLESDDDSVESADDATGLGQHPCGKCSEDTSGTMCIACYGCKKWFHVGWTKKMKKCVPLENKTEFESLKRSKARWFCEVCNVLVADFFARLLDVEKKVNDVAGTVGDLASRVTAVEKELQMQQKTYADAVAVTRDLTEDKPSKVVQELSEVQQKLKKKCNVILHDAKINGSEDVKVRIHADEEIAKAIITASGAEAHVVRVRRLRKFSDGKMTGYLDKLVVSLQTEDQKQAVLNGRTEGSITTADGVSLRVSPDRTYQERLAARKRYISWNERIERGRKVRADVEGASAAASVERSDNRRAPPRSVTQAAASPKVGNEN